MPNTDRDRILRTVRRRGSITASEATRAGIHSQHLTRLVAEGVLERVSRGRYLLTDRLITEHHALATVGASVPGGVICLLSALNFHGIGTQVPADVWVAIERGKRPPSLRQLPLRVVRFSGVAFTEGVEIHRVEGQVVRVYSVAKTLADLFRYRNQVGLDVTIEALREAWQERRFTMEALERAAKVCRVSHVMRPYVAGVVT
jgi:predicted transcriptional regulator of viral defense system